MLVSFVASSCDNLLYSDCLMQMKIVFNSFSKISSQFSAEDRLLYAYEILLPLYKVCEGFAGKVISGDFSLLILVLHIFNGLRELMIFVACFQ